MTAPLAGFICALVMAAVVIIWITYCMFFKERHKSEHYQHDISDLRVMNYELALEEGPVKKESGGVKAGIFILPSRHKHKKDEDYDKRPDYPESPVPVLQPDTDKLVEIFTESAVDADVHSKDGVFAIDSNSQYHSDV